MSKGFEDWTMEDVKRHNERVQKGAFRQKQKEDVSIYTSAEKTPKKAKYRNEKTIVNRGKVRQ